MSVMYLYPMDFYWHSTDDILPGFQLPLKCIIPASSVYLSEVVMQCESFLYYILPSVMYISINGLLWPVMFE